MVMALDINEKKKNSTATMTIVPSSSFVAFFG
jgi:hypothetical protein